MEQGKKNLLIILVLRYGGGGGEVLIPFALAGCKLDTRWIYLINKHYKVSDLPTAKSLLSLLLLKSLGVQSSADKELVSFLDPS